MNSNATDETQSLVIVARAVRTRGLKGEIVADLLTDFPERFNDLGELIVVSPTNLRRVVKLENHWFLKDRVILKFVGCDDLESAEALIGYDFAVPESERVVLPEGSFYDWELEGCKVEMPGGESIGQVEAVLQTGAAPVLVVRSEAGGEKLIPFAEPVIQKIDTANKVVIIDPPAGLLDL